MNLRLIYNNRWRKGTVLTPSSEDFKHPSSDTQVDTKEQYYKAGVKTQPCLVPVNLLAAYVIDSVAIIGHNFEPSGVTIKFQGATNSAFSTGLVTETLTYNADSIFAYFMAWAAKQYVRIRLEKASDFTDFPQIATVLCGLAFVPNRNIGKGYSEGNEDLSVEQYSDAHALFVQEKPIIDVGRYPFHGLDDATRDEILDFFKEVGTHKAFILTLDKDAPNTTSKIVKNTDLVSPVFEGARSPTANIWAWELAVEEIS